MASKKMVKPLHDNVIVEMLVQKTSEGGIVLPDSLEGTSSEGIVVEVGPGRLLDGMSVARSEMSVAVGDHVIFHRGAGTEVNFGKKLVVLPESQIICRVTEVDQAKTETRKLQSV
jgi:chaperonin GroES